MDSPRISTIPDEKTLSIFILVSQECNNLPRIPWPAQFAIENAAQKENKNGMKKLRISLDLTPLSLVFCLFSIFRPFSQFKGAQCFISPQQAQLMSAKQRQQQTSVSEI